jgi:endonuclease/exonuclease/phosphatase family metal-dependent hydrolase
LAERGIHSAYHTYFKEEHGEETRPTFYLYKNKAKPYHIDYCFVSDKFTVETVKVVDVDCSDHSPVIITLSEGVISPF